MKQVIAMHGWSGDSTVWAPWERHFSHQGWLWRSGERGYGNRQCCSPNWAEPTSGETSQSMARQRRVVIAHSLGPHLLEPSVLGQATDLVLLASFGRFVPQGSAGRALRTGLRGMQKAIGRPGEASMLRTFLKRAAQPAEVDGLPPGLEQQGLSERGRHYLREDLECLIGTSGLPAGLPKTARVLVVDGTDDAIVAPAASREHLQALKSHLQAAPEQWQLRDVGHALLVPDLLVRVQQWLDHHSRAS
ncbi:alpha/beta hydrolase [Synechococcus sp. UW179A]|uniref:alpha/beta hydrolase n=1 Tax=Synechococcus sp. UW179A TaxID=2575510 RepID=UPI000E0E22A5|nr:alpha/beta hydrolase [Synechococcus sp. UW179A]